MYPYIHIILPSYLVMALIGGFFALTFMYLRIEKFQMDFSTFLKMFIACLAGGYAGAKLLYSFTQIPWLFENFSLKNLIMLIPRSGLVFYGGLFGVIFTLLYITRKNPDLRKSAFGVCVPAMPLFHAFGRIGCFLTGCCYGKELSHPIQLGVLTLNRVPTQLIESVSEISLFIILLIVERKRKETDLLRIYLVAYAVIRFINEFFRGDEIRGVFLGLSTSQWISLMILVYYAIQIIKVGLPSRSDTERHMNEVANDDTE